MLARFQVLTLTIVLALCLFSVGRAQTQDDSVAAQKAAAEKFLQLLLSRPQPGTALDKTVEYYQSIGELDALFHRIKLQAAEEQTSQPEAAARHWLAVALMAQSQARWLESIELLQHAPDVDQQRWAIGQTHAVACEQLQRWSATIEVLQPLIDQAIEQPRLASAESVIEGSRRLAKAYARLGQTDKAIKVWQKLEARFGRDEQIATRLASMAADEGELDFAVEVLDRILAGKLPATKRMELAIQRTGLVARAGHEDRAIADYEQLLAGLNADSWLATDIAQRIEDLVVGRDGVETLLKYYRSQLAKRPDDMNVMLRLASALDREKKWEESNQLFKQLIERTSTALAPRLAYAQSLVHQELWHAAATEFAKLAEQQPRNDDVITLWCEAISADDTVDASQRAEQVRSILEKGIEGVAPTAEAYQQLAARLQRFGHAERAVHWLVKAYQLQPDDLGVLSDYCRSLQELGRQPEILQVTSAFEAANRSNRDVLSQLADLYADLEDHDLAIACLSRACQLGATSSMRFRLSDWFEKAQRPTEAAEQLELAWDEIAAQTRSPNEQETLCEEITRRQKQLATRQDKLEEALAKLQSVGSANSQQPALAGLDAEAVAAWRVARFLAASGQVDLANEHVQAVLRRYPNSTMIWRLRAELAGQSKRLTEAVEAHRKLAELDVRRRSEHLLEVAKGLARMGRVEAALQQTEALTTETASSQIVIEVFNLALENRAEKFAIDLLTRRLQARPGDIEVLQRLIRYHLDKHAFQKAADYQWQNLQLMRTPEQRQIAVELLIETHVQLRSLSKLEQQLEKYWRQHDLWREFGVWQAMIALRGDNQLRAENLLMRLAQSQTTRRFALEHLLKLAEMQSNGLKRFELMKQLFAIDPQAIHAEAIAKVLIDLPQEHRSPQQVQDALSWVRGSSKRLALIQDLIQGGSVDMALRLIDGLPESERRSWPIVCRTALLWAALPKAKVAAGGAEVPAYVESAAAQLQSFSERSLELPETMVGQRLLEELLDSQKYIAELLVTITYFSHSPAANQSISHEASNCRSALQAYQAVIAAQLQVSQSPAERRDVLSRQRQLAMQQTDPRERAARLAALAIVAHWQSKAPTFQQVTLDLDKQDARERESKAAMRESLIRKRLTNLMANELPPTDYSLASRLASVSAEFGYMIAELNELADQGDSLAALLCLWEMAHSQRDLLEPANEDMLKRTDQWCRNLGEYAALAPAQIFTLMASLQMKDHPEQASEYLATLSRMEFDKDGLKRVLRMVLDKHDPSLIKALIASQVEQAVSLELLGELAGGRYTEADIQPVDLWRAMDYAWQSEVKLGLRAQNKLLQPIESYETSWSKALPLCSIPMHESSVFRQLDFNVVRAIVGRAGSTNARQELLKVIKQLVDEPADSNLRLVRQLAQVFVMELFEQDSQSSKLLDVALPPDSSATVPSAVVLRGLWLDIIGKHDSAIEWWFKFHQWPEEVRESTAGLMLELAMRAHHDEAIDIAARELRAATSDLSGYHARSRELIERDMLPQAEMLLGEFRVLLPPNAERLVVSASLLELPGMNVDVIVRWGQTDILFSLLQKYSQIDNKEGVYRMARRLIGGVETASDDEFRNNLVYFVQRFRKSFRNEGQLAEFLDVESRRMDPVASPRQALCVLRLITDLGLAEMAHQIVDRMTSGELTAMQLLEIARCELKLGQTERAAQFFARTFELQPDWMDSSMAGLNERSQTVHAIAFELNKSSKPGAGIGVASLDVLLKAIPSSQLASYPRLWIGWAGNSRPKSLPQMRTLIRQLREENFELWTNVVEQLLLTDDLQPVTAAFDNSDHWASRLSGSSSIEQQLLGARTSAEERAMFEAMLLRVIAKSSDDFLARLMLARVYLSAGNLSAAAEQLPPLVGSVPRGAIKSWLLTEWRTEIFKRQVTSPAVLNAMLNRTKGTVTSAEMDKHARAKLLQHLLDIWDSSTAQSTNRMLLAEAVVQMNGLPALSAAWQIELLKHYASQRDEARVLSLFEPEFIQTQNGQKPSVSIPYESLRVLASNGMDWQRQLIMIREAQLARLPLHLSPLYLRQQNVDAASRTGQPALVPSQVPNPELIERLVTESRQLLPAADWNSANASTWCECFKPQLVIDPKKQTIEFVSMLDVVWPEERVISNELRTRIDAAVQSWSKELTSLGAWQTLALHNLAARLGDEPLVARIQEQLLEKASSQATTADRQWRLACWSAVRASRSMASLKQQRFRLGEIARNAAAEYGRGLSNVYSLMTVAQLELVSGGSELKDQDPAVDKMLSDGSRIAQRNRDLQSWEPEAIVTHVKINMLLFDKLVTQGNVDLAIELLRNMRANEFVVGTTNGIAVAPLNGRAVQTQTFELLDTFQRLIDTKTEPERLQVLLEELLLKPLPRQLDGWNTAGSATFADDFRDFDKDVAAAPTGLPQRNMYTQLVQLARMNNSLSELHTRLLLDVDKRGAHAVCRALIELEEGKVGEALKTYGAQLSASGVFLRDAELFLIRDSIFNVVKKDPLSEEALAYSSLALQQPLNLATANLLRQQFKLATKHDQPDRVDGLLVILSHAWHVPTVVRDRLRVDYALELLKAKRVKASWVAYMKGQALPDTGAVKAEPDVYVVELMNRLPSLDRNEQADIFGCFLSREGQAFPWLECYATPATEPLPQRFRHPDVANGLVFQALDRHDAWLSFIPWIAEYAELTAQNYPAVEAATNLGVNHPAAAWGAAALAARLNTRLTPAALKNRLDSAGVRPSPPTMHALLDCCQHNEPLRAAAVEIILNLGYPAIALASPVKDAKLPGWKHWLVLHEETLASSSDPRPRWSLAKNGQWTAQSTSDLWYLMLRYPIEGDFQLSVSAQQVSGSKFGIGCGGVAAVQHTTDPVVRCVGVGQRRLQDLIPTELSEAAEVPMKVERQGSNWTLQAASASFTEVTDDFVPIVYFANQGPGSTRLDNWQLSSDLKLARQADLLDSQMRMWRTTLGSWKLPVLRAKGGELGGPKPTAVHVTDGTLHLPSSQSEGDSTDDPTSALHCLRPLQSEETIAYEFFSAADSATVHPALGRMVFRLDGDQVRLQWLMQADDRKWLGLANDQLGSLEANEITGALKIAPNAWNRIELTLGADSRVVLKLNGQSIAQVVLPPQVAAEFGLIVPTNLAAQVRNVRLSGPWPETLSLEQLKQ